MTVNMKNREDTEEKKQEEMEVATPEPGTPWTEGELQQAA